MSNHTPYFVAAACWCNVQMSGTEHVGGNVNISCNVHGSCSVYVSCHVRVGCMTAAMCCSTIEPATKQLGHGSELAYLGEGIEDALLQGYM